MDELTQLANKYASDKGTLAPNDGRRHGDRLHFTTKYFPYMQELKNEKINFLEIGIGSGPSLKMWYEFFPNANIFAIDIENKKMLENERVKTFIADQSDRNSLQKFINETKTQFDIIIDDGGHMMQQQQVSFGFLFKHLKSNGQYWVEDLHTSFWPILNSRSGKMLDNLYGTPLDINEDRSNTTFDFLNKIVEANIAESLFLTKEENQYLIENIKQAEMFELPKSEWGPNYLAFFRKK